MLLKGPIARITGNNVVIASVKVQIAGRIIAKKKVRIEAIVQTIVKAIDKIACKNDSKD